MAARPGGVTLVAVLAWINGAIAIVRGIIYLFDARGDGAVIAGAAIGIAIGVLIIVVAVGLLRGSNVARVLTTIFQALSLLSAVFTLFARPSDWLAAVITGVIALVVILLLYTRRANEFFAGR